MQESHEEDMRQISRAHETRGRWRYPLEIRTTAIGLKDVTHAAEEALIRVRGFILRQE